MIAQAMPDAVHLSVMSHIGGRRALGAHDGAEMESSSRGDPSLAFGAIWDRNMPEESSSRGQIFVVDDEPAVRGTLSVILCRDGYEVACFAEGESFLAAARARAPACILLDVHLPGRSGLDILKDLNADEYPVPILMISGKGDIPMAVEAIKQGALDFIEKPFRASTVSACVQAAIAARSRRGLNGLPAEFAGRKPLTKREGEVLAQLVIGASSKEAAAQLGISPRTIEIHRAHIMGKLGAKNIADLVRIVMSERRTS
jgi:FixJ family two-component response regulator